MQTGQHDPMSITPKLAPSSVAPWAEVVPDTPQMTVDELEAMPDDGWAYELVAGTLVRMPLSSGGASNIGMRLAARLSIYVEEHGLGAVTGEQGGYRLDPAHSRTTEVGPDVAFVRAERVPDPASSAFYEAWRPAPDLAVEVASDNQFAPGMKAKALFYLSFGTRLVWVIWPHYRRVDIWHPGDKTPTALGVDDLLSGEGVVPGFTFPIARLFP